MALIECYNCGHRVSQNALECPHCHVSFTLNDYLKGKTGFVFVASCLLLCLHAIICFVSWNCVRTMNIELFDSLATISPIIIGLYLIGMTGVVYALSPSLKSKRLRLFLIGMCVLVFCFRELMFISFLNTPVFRILFYILEIVIFSILVWKVNGAVRYYILVLLLSAIMYLCAFVYNICTETVYDLEYTICRTCELGAMILQVVASTCLLGFYFVCLVRRK